MAIEWKKDDLLTLKEKELESKKKDEIKNLPNAIRALKEENNVLKQCLMEMSDSVYA